MTDDELRAVNGIPPRMLVKAGSTLLVPRGAQRLTDVSEKVADGATMALVHDGPALRRVVFRAGKKGDSVAAVAKRYKVSIDQVANWNRVGNKAQFAPGSSVVVYVAARGAKTSSARGSKPATAQRKAATMTAAKRSSTPIKAVAAPKVRANR